MRTECMSKVLLDYFCRMLGMLWKRDFVLCYDSNRLIVMFFREVIGNLYQ